MSRTKKIIVDNPETVPSPEKLCELVKAGSNQYVHNSITEAIIIDEKWLISIEQYMMSMENIVRRPKSFIIDDEYIENIEKVKKITPKSIRHLIQNTRLIASVDDDGEVMPKKLLTVQIDETLAIYENRFVCTLINKLSLFLEHRYKMLAGIVETKDTTELSVRSVSKFKRTEVAVESRVFIKEPSRNEILVEKNRNLMLILQKLRKRCALLKASNFYVQLNALKPIQPPIMKTNLLTKNLDYSNCYKLWLFISAYTLDGFFAEVKRKDLPVDKEYFEDMNSVIADNVYTLIANDYIRRRDYKAIVEKEFKEKKYNVVSKFNNDLRFKLDKKEEIPDLINQYYFDEMKKLINKTVKQKSGNVYNDDKDIKMTFPKFYRAFSKINRTIFMNVLELDNPKKLKDKQRGAIARKEVEIANQKELYRRYHLLNRLASDELELMLKYESKELVKCEKLQFELDILKDKDLYKNPDKKKRKRTVTKRPSKAGKVVSTAKDRVSTRSGATEQELLANEKLRQDEVIRIKHEQYLLRKDAYERRMYERLKAKFERPADDEVTENGAETTAVDNAAIEQIPPETALNSTNSPEDK